MTILDDGTREITLSRDGEVFYSEIKPSKPAKKYTKKELDALHAKVLKEYKTFVKNGPFGGK